MILSRCFPYLYYDIQSGPILTKHSSCSQVSWQCLSCVYSGFREVEKSFLMQNNFPFRLEVFIHFDIRTVLLSWLGHLILSQKVEDNLIKSSKIRIKLSPCHESEVLCQCRDVFSPDNQLTATLDTPSCLESIHKNVQIMPQTKIPLESKILRTILIHLLN